VAWLDAGRYAEAQSPLEHALVFWEQALGPEHPDVAQSFNNLAELYRVQGRYADAEPHYQWALAILEKVFGPKHPDVAIVIKNYAALLRATNRDVETAGLEVRWSLTLPHSE
jgi:tetratricopeptide (TPR) repeat protein